MAPADNTTNTSVDGLPGSAQAPPADTQAGGEATGQANRRLDGGASMKPWFVHVSLHAPSDPHTLPADWPRPFSLAQDRGKLPKLK